MKQLHYCLVDVFTNQPFGGNQLAVFPDARGLTPEIMQALAKELNLSESAFVLPAQDAASDYRVRFFTPLQSNCPWRAIRRLELPLCWPIKA